MQVRYEPLLLSRVTLRLYTELLQYCIDLHYQAAMLCLAMPAGGGLSRPCTSPAVNPFSPVACLTHITCCAGKRVSASHPPCKSELMLLSEKFRDRFANSAGDDSSSRIDLNDCALALGVPRRRLYDITIVYEAAEVQIDTVPDLVKSSLAESRSSEPRLRTPRTG